MAKLVIGNDKTVVTPAVVKEVAAQYVVRYQKDGNDVLQKVAQMPDLTGVTGVGVRAFQSSFNYSTFPANTALDFSMLTSVNFLSFNAAFFYATGITSIDLSGLTSVSGAYSFEECFYGSSATSVDMSNVEVIGTEGNPSGSGFNCYWMFNAARNLTTYNLSSLRCISGSRNCENMFRLTAVTTADLPNLEVIAGYQAAKEMFADNGQTLTSVNLPKLREILPAGTSGNTCSYMFSNARLLQSVYLPSITSGDLSSRCTVCTCMFENSGVQVMDLRNLRSVGNYGIFDNMFAYMSYLTTLNVNALERIGTQGARAFLYCSSSISALTDLYFPMLTSFGTDPFYTNAFTNRVINIHFRKDAQATVEALANYDTMFGAAQGSAILFDLAGTLTGADGNDYARSEKDSVYVSETAGAAKTATAWEYNSTTYYTSGGTEPQVGDTIYSDSTCTTAVTTVSAIA